MQLYAAYAEGNNLREIATIIGSEALGERDKIYLQYADRFEREFIAQGENEKRTVEQTLDIGWKLFSMLPEEDLKLINEKWIKKYLPKYREAKA
jgi:V/A-type H+/Na+-transporting ATPase subunit B